MKKLVVTEIWVKADGYLVKVQWNACRCCPNAVCMTWGTKFSESGWYGDQNKSKWTKKLKNQGWIRLDREVWSFGEIAI